MANLWSTLAPLALGALVGVGAPWPIKALVHVLRGQADRDERAREASVLRDAAERTRDAKRVEDLEELVGLLRKALDKHLIRESAVASACELLIALAKLVPNPSPAMLHIRERAQQLLEDARAQTLRVDSAHQP